MLGGAASSFVFCRLLSEYVIHVKLASSAQKLPIAHSLGCPLKAMVAEDWAAANVKKELPDAPAPPEADEPCCELCGAKPNDLVESNAQRGLALGEPPPQHPFNVSSPFPKVWACSY